MARGEEGWRGGAVGAGVHLLPKHLLAWVASCEWTTVRISSEAEDGGWGGVDGKMWYVGLGAGRRGMSVERRGVFYVGLRHTGTSVFLGGT